MEWLEAFLHRPSCRRVLQQETLCARVCAGLGQEAHRSAGLCPPLPQPLALGKRLREPEGNARGGAYFPRDIFKVEDGNRLQKPAGRSCGAFTFSVGRVRHESRGEETR